MTGNFDDELLTATVHVTGNHRTSNTKVSKECTRDNSWHIVSPKNESVCFSETHLSFPYSSTVWWTQCQHIYIYINIDKWQCHEHVFLKMFCIYIYIYIFHFKVFINNSPPCCWPASGNVCVNKCNTFLLGQWSQTRSSFQDSIQIQI